MNPSDVKLLAVGAVSGRALTEMAVPPEVQFPNRVREIPAAGNVQQRDAARAQYAAHFLQGAFDVRHRVKVENE